ncbi:MAG: aspartyl/glutamyl-tRNA(Asn/Gln) amidotransferase subunit B [Phycisphaerae bacterium]|nr:MAG: Asp-tRNA(Asn)/Glu-tRNA(Gln) amidotransferase subunit GatB [Planctomycetia bacterium]GJQ27056.1 MAG: aspartyl/glutamyl-tRNA(Asn/Gln) amidotransferase subunit B [Phycisphaerae bacterium]
MQIRPIIGMEIHVQLATRTKLFCPCPLEFAAEPNSRVCPVCLGLPGSLPVMNRRAYELAVRAALALGCRIAPFTKWDRKSYFYPDLPKNYQISQYDLPLSFDGVFEMPMTAEVPPVQSRNHRQDGHSVRRIGIIRAHLEEDAGKNLHEGVDYSRVDLNRAGTPLLEIVTRPDLASADECYTFAVELQRLVKFLGVSEANMQKGQMRFEPNVNLAITHDGREYRTPISEIKNLNSFRSVRLAVEYEIKRQTAAWQDDHDYTLERLGKMNFGWDDEREVTEFQRGKEESHDYRYFPDPDLVPVTPDPAWVEQQRSEIGELPLARRARLIRDYGVTEKDCEILLADRATAELFDTVVTTGVDARTVIKQFVGIWNNLASAANNTIAGLGVPAKHVADLARAVQDGAISPSAAATIAEQLAAPTRWDADPSRDREAAGSTPSPSRGEGRDAGVPGNLDKTQSVLDLARELGLLQVRDESATQAWVDEAFATNPQAVADALGDNERKAKAAPGFLRGQVMKLSGGKADPKLTGELIERKLAALKQQK